MASHRFLLLVTIAFAAVAAGLYAGQPAVPGPNRPDEPKAGKFSLPAAVKFLDGAAADWTRKRQCFACHTNYAYLYLPPRLGADAKIASEVRSEAEKLVTDRWPKKGPRWDAEVVATAAALAANDAATTGKLHPATRTALDRIWKVQRQDGGFTWLKCNWPPMESDDDYGVALAAIAVGLAPEKYAESPAAKAGLAGLKKYLANNPAPTLHHRAMWLWAATMLPDFMTAAEKERTIADLLAKQLPSGGWSAASLGNWRRADGSPQDVGVADGYGTGFALYVLRKAGVPATEERIAKGAGWLKREQRASGRWYARSLFRDGNHYLSHVGTAFAVMALAECEKAGGG